MHLPEWKQNHWHQPQCTELTQTINFAWPNLEHQILVSAILCLCHHDILGVSALGWCEAGSFRNESFWRKNWTPLSRISCDHMPQFHDTCQCLTWCMHKLPTLFKLVWSKKVLVKASCILHIVKVKRPYIFQCTQLTCQMTSLNYLLWALFIMFWFHTEMSTCWLAGDREGMLHTSDIDLWWPCKEYTYGLAMSVTGTPQARCNSNMIGE